MSSQADDRAAVGPILERLRSEYGEMAWRPHLDPMAELILTILSQHTSDRLSGQAFARLLQTFSGWAAICDAPEQAILNCIRIGGLAQQKAPRIRAVLQQVRTLTGGFELDLLADLPLQEAKDWLTALPGVGPKTAACVLMFALGRPAIPVDTHVYRLGLRLGLIPNRMNAERAHAHLEALVSSADAYALHVGLIRHGRHVCTAQRPRCESCALSELCPSAFTSGQRKRASPDVTN